MKHKIILSLSFILALLLASVIVISFFDISKTEGTVNLDSNDAFEKLYFKFPDNVQITGSFTVNSTGNKTVYFWVTSDTSSESIVSPFMANESASLEFITNGSGYYSFVFDNEYDFHTPKTVLFSFTTQVGGLGVYLSLTSWIALVISIILIVTLAIYLRLRYKSKEQTMDRKRDS